MVINFVYATVVLFLFWCIFIRICAKNECRFLRRLENIYNTGHYSMSNESIQLFVSSVLTIVSVIILLNITASVYVANEGYGEKKNYLFVYKGDISGWAFVGSGKYVANETNKTLSLKSYLYGEDRSFNQEEIIIPKRTIKLTQVLPDYAFQEAPFFSVIVAKRDKSVNGFDKWVLNYK